MIQISVNVTKVEGWKDMFILQQYSSCSSISRSSAHVIVKNAIDDCRDYISVETSCVAVVNQTSSDFHCYYLT